VWRLFSVSRAAESCPQRRSNSAVPKSLLSEMPLRAQHRKPWGRVRVFYISYLEHGLWRVTVAEWDGLAEFALWTPAAPIQRVAHRGAFDCNNDSTTSRSYSPIRTPQEIS